MKSRNLWFCLQCFDPSWFNNISWNKLLTAAVNAAAHCFRNKGLAGRKTLIRPTLPSISAKEGLLSKQKRKMCLLMCPALRKSGDRGNIFDGHISSWLFALPIFSHCKGQIPFRRSSRPRGKVLKCAWKSGFFSPERHKRQHSRKRETHFRCLRRIGRDERKRCKTLRRTKSFPAHLCFPAAGMQQRLQTSSD